MARRHKSREGSDLLRQGVDDGVETIDGREFKRVVLPEQAPPPKRNQTSRYHLSELRGDAPKKKRRRKSKSRRQHEQREKAKRVQ